jgi:hypothetical protein
LKNENLVRQNEPQTQYLSPTQTHFHDESQTEKRKQQLVSLSKHTNHSKCRRQNNTMGYDLSVLFKMFPRESFEKTCKGKGYFRHGGGVMRALELVGVDMKAKALRVNGFAPDDTPFPCPLVTALSYYNGLLITPEECRDIASKFTAEPFF